jgi:hypothetical protein
MSATETPQNLKISWSEGWKGGAPAVGETIGTGQSATYNMTVRSGIYTVYRKSHGAREWEVLLPSQGSGTRAYKACVDDNKAGIV